MHDASPNHFVTRSELAVLIDRLDGRFDGIDQHLGTLAQQIADADRHLVEAVGTMDQRMDRFERGLNRVLVVFGTAFVIARVGL